MRATEQVDGGLFLPKGAGKIELFDERGRKEYEQPFENALCAMGVYHNRWMVRYDYARGMPGTPFTTAAHSRKIDPMRGVILTDSTEAEGGVLEGMSLGNLIGWADKQPYNGSSIYRGSVNTNECSMNETTVTWVWDFATNAALGTVGSVGVGPITSMVGGTADNRRGMPAVFYENKGLLAQSNSNPAYVILDSQGMLEGGIGANNSYPCGIAQLASGNFVIAPNFANTGASAPGLVTYPADYASWVAGTGRLSFGPRLANLGFTLTGALQPSVAVSGSNVWVANLNRLVYFPDSALGSLDVTESVVTLDSSWTNIRDITHDGTYIWLAEAATNKAIRINATAGTLVSQWTCPNAALGEVIEGIAYDAGLGRLWVTTYISGYERLYLCELDGTITAAMSMAMQVGTPGTSYGSGTIGELTIQSGDLTSSVGSGALPGTRPKLVVTADGRLLCSFMSGSGIALIDPKTMGTRTKLSSPVTKTGFQAMKLTYTFSFS